MSTDKTLPEPFGRVTQRTSGLYDFWEPDQHPYLDTAVSITEVYSLDQLRAALEAERAQHAPMVTAYWELHKAEKRLRSQVEALRAQARWDIKCDGNDLLVCFYYHHNSDESEYQRFVPCAQVESLRAERQREAADHKQANEDAARYMREAEALRSVLQEAMQQAVEYDGLDVSKIGPQHWYSQVAAAMAQTPWS